MATADEHVDAMVPGLRRLAPQLVLAGVLPLVGYALIRPHVDSDATALAAVMVFPLIDIVRERRRHGRLEPIGVISLVAITIGIVGAIVFRGDATLLKVRESMLTGVFGIVCLVSLAMARPAMFYVGRSFATGGDPEQIASFNELWALPGVPRRFRFVTAVWGVALIAEAGVRTVLALTISTTLFLVVTPIINWGVIGLLLWFTVWYRRRGQSSTESAIVDAEPAG